MAFFSPSGGVRLQDFRLRGGVDCKIPDGKYSRASLDLTHSDLPPSKFTKNFESTSQDEFSKTLEYWLQNSPTRGYQWRRTSFAKRSFFCDKRFRRYSMEKSINFQKLRFFRSFNLFNLEYLKDGPFLFCKIVDIAQSIGPRIWP